jgi:glycosyltransferase-like protein
MPTPRRIALFTYSTKPRGGVIHTLELAAALQQDGHFVRVYALDKEGEGFGRSLPFEVQLVPAAAVLGGTDPLIQQRIQELWDFLAAHPPECDIYHAQDCITANALVQLRQQGLIPHVVRTVHHIDQFNSPYLQACQDRSIREPDLCLCVSQLWQQALHVEYGVIALRVTNGVNQTRFSAQPTGREPHLKQQLGLSGWPVYLTVGGIEPRKNTLNLLHAFAMVLQQSPHAQLVIAGGATLFDYQDYRDRCLAFLQTSPIILGQSLILPGVVEPDDLPTLYRCADAFVFPSLKEGWGLVVLEAIASRLPVITANIPPFSEFLTSESALLVDPEEPAAIAQAMSTVLNPNVATSLRQHSQLICDRYSWQRSAHLHQQHYETLLATRGH